MLDLPWYLIGRSQAILKVASTSAALWIGLLLVFSAGFAREYDGVDLLREPWHLLLPLVASLATSFLLYLLVFIGARTHGVKQLSFWGGYRTLLTFYWWTAPLAWFYAVPVERWMSSGDAAYTNLYILAAVSLWRVLLITRAISVWLSASYFKILLVVLFFADTVALGLMYITPKPVFNIMGGVRLEAADHAILDASLVVFIFGGLAWLPLLGLALFVIENSKPQWSNAVPADLQRGVSKSLWLTASAAVLVGIALLPFGQPEQQHRSTAEAMLHANQIEEAVKYAGRYERHDFPPVWNPPPRLSYYENKPSVVAVLEAVEQQGGPEWLRVLYSEKLAQDPSGGIWSRVGDVHKADRQDLERTIGVLERNVPVSAIDSREIYDLQRLIDDERIDADLRDRLRNYLGSSSDSNSTEDHSSKL